MFIFFFPIWIRIELLILFECIESSLQIIVLYGEQSENLIFTVRRVNVVECLAMLSSE